MSIRLALTSLSLLTALSLVACGGGDGGTLTGPAAGAPPPSSAAATSSGSTCGLPDFAASALARVNQLRAGGADCGSSGRFASTTPLAWSDKLTQAADAHSKDMAANNYFSHTSADGRSLADRVSATGYVWSSLGENIAAGYPDVNAVIDGWVASPGHCANLMAPGFTEVGLVCVPKAAGSTYSTYGTMDLARAK